MLRFLWGKHCVTMSADKAFRCFADFIDNGEACRLETLDGEIVRECVTAEAEVWFHED